MEPVFGVNLKLIQTFMIVAEAGSFRLAAERLRRSHSAISLQIRNLEEQLGVRLFARTTRSLSLTPEGEFLLESAAKAVREVQSGVRHVIEAGDTKRGSLSVGCSPHIASIYFPPILTDFVRKNPGVRVSVRELTTRELYEALRRREVDFALGPQLAEVDLSYQTLFYDQVQALVPERFLPFMPEAGPQVTSTEPSHSARIAWRDLVTMPVLLPSEDTAMRRLFEATLSDLGLSVEPIYQFIQAETIIAMAEAGLGVAVQPASRLHKFDPQSARAFDLIEPEISRPMALISRRGERLAPAARRLADQVIELMGRTTVIPTGR